MNEVWYVSYGSNMNRGRFMKYIEGGTAGMKTYPGARDKSAPKETIDLTLPYPLKFAGDSSVWTGGVAYLDINRGGSTRAVGYRITMEQFIDVVSQENKLDVPVVIKEHAGNYEIVSELPKGSVIPLYDKIVNLGDSDGVPMLTFTSSDLDSWVETEPSAAYINMLTDNGEE